MQPAPSSVQRPQEQDKRCRKAFILQGQVQGVGFRPFAFSLAQRLGLSGHIANTQDGVYVEVQGTQAQLTAWQHALQTELPPLARITRQHCQELPWQEDERTFQILNSQGVTNEHVLISPDVAICADCWKEMHTPGTRRYLYPFTNCTHCGPRYSITHSVPYDRSSTSMACFPLCPECLAEYHNPHDRRFHAQANACPRCGPQLWFVHSPATTQYTTEHSQPEQALVRNEKALEAAAAALHEGAIVAIKGIGGFHLACDASRHTAVTRLRKAKHRPVQPFALMAPSMAVARRIAHLSVQEERLLQSKEHPIVICQLRQEYASLLATAVPLGHTVGIMLPYTPLHAALFAFYTANAKATALPLFVMTSGNPKGQPLCTGNREALSALGHMADAFLLHNRDILVRVDDSIVRHSDACGTLFYRKARGYVPAPLPLHLPTPATVLALGADLKNTFCLTKDEHAFVSQHIGDMQDMAVAQFQHEARMHMQTILSVRPARVAMDRHPAYSTHHMAHTLGLPTLEVQHHVAHGYAVLAEHASYEPAIGLILDGTGFGDDTNIWGGEILLLTPQKASYQRLAHCTPIFLPGGEAAIHEPWRIAHALLWRMGELDSPTAEQTQSGYRLPWMPACAHIARHIPAMLEQGLNCPATSSAGRLFDAVAALLGLCLHTSYEGEAAQRLEEAQLYDAAHSLHTLPQLTSADLCHETRKAPQQVATDTLFASVLQLVATGTPIAQVARFFHRHFARMMLDAALAHAKEQHITRIVFSGGCMQNVHLITLLATACKAAGYTALFHQHLPPNDACISLGQTAYTLLTQGQQST